MQRKARLTVVSKRPAVLATITDQWHPQQLSKPAVDPELPQLSNVQRSVEVFRYSILSWEWWLCPSGALREWLRLNLIAALIIGIPAVLIVPIVTYLLGQFVTWTELLVGIAKNLAIFPVLAVIGVAIITGIIYGARILLRLLLKR
jgi:hypothetical protein